MISPAKVTEIAKMALFKEVSSVFINFAQKIGVSIPNQKPVVSTLSSLPPVKPATVFIPSQEQVSMDAPALVV